MSYPKNKLKSFLNDLNKIVVPVTREKYNTIILQYLNKPFTQFLKGKKNTLASRGWKRHIWYISDKTLGSCDYYEINNKFDRNEIHSISFNKLFLVEDNADEYFESVLRHEISHALELEYYGDTEDNTSRLCETCAKAFGREYYNNGLPQIETNFTWATRYYIVFEPFASDEGFVNNVNKIPSDYKINPGYIYTTIIDRFKNTIIDENFPEDDTARKIISKFGIKDVLKRRLKVEHTQNQFESIFIDNQIDESFGQYLKGTAAGLGLLGTTLFPNYVDAAKTKDTTTITQPVNKTKTITINKNSPEKLILAATIWDEARGEKSIGREAVASVIYNRAQQKRWRKLGLIGVVLQKMQFSGWNDKKVTVKLANKNDHKIWDECLSLAESLLNKTFVPIIKSNHYYNSKLASPAWGKKMKNIDVIGNHTFGEL